MAHFYGTLQGNRGKATRCGTKNSGLAVTAASWKGSIQVTLWAEDDGDHFRVEQVPWYGRGCHELLATGMVGKPQPPEEVAS